MNIIPAEKEMPQDNWFAETRMLVSIGKTRKEVICRATNFAVTESASTYQIEIYGIQIVGLKTEDYEKIPLASQKMIKTKLIQNLTEKLEAVRRLEVQVRVPAPTAA